MNMMTTLNLRAMVTSENGEAKTTSYAIAEAFEKTHSHVMRDIKKLIKQCGEEFAKSNFGLTFENKKIGNTTRSTPFYRISKDGFMLLVMGFTGEKAMKTKIDFINAFNWMANQLTQVFQSKWARYNHIVGYRNNRKQQATHGDVFHHCRTRFGTVVMPERNAVEIAEHGDQIRPNGPEQNTKQGNHQTMKHKHGTV